MRRDADDREVAGGRGSLGVGEGTRGRGLGKRRDGGEGRCKGGDGVDWGKVDSGGCGGSCSCRGRGCLHITPLDTPTTPTATATVSATSATPTSAGNISGRLVSRVASGSQARPPPPTAGQADPRHGTKGGERHGRLAKSPLTVVVATATATATASGVGVRFGVSASHVVRGSGGEGQGLVATSANALAGEEKGREGEGGDHHEH